MIHLTFPFDKEEREMSEQNLKCSMLNRRDTATNIWYSLMICESSCFLIYLDQLLVTSFFFEYTKVNGVSV